jgi:hypothetical protein
MEGSTKIMGRVLKTVLAVLGALILFMLIFVAVGLGIPVPHAFIQAAPPRGMLPSGLDFLFFGLTTAGLAFWIAQRSAYRGLGRAAQVFLVIFGAQTLMTQIETGYFLDAFPLLHRNFELYRLVLRGAVWAAALALIVAWLTGAFSRKAAVQTPTFHIDATAAIRASAWLPIVYTALYFLFGYFVAWKSEAVRLFYSGSAVDLGFFGQWGSSLMDKPELPVFQYLRGLVWILCLVPVFLGFTGGRRELIILSGLTLALLPTAQLAFPNPLMPAEVSRAHFWEVAISTGLFGIACGLVLPRERESKLPSNQ